VAAEADVVVLANAADALRLLGYPPWPVLRVRGQVSSVDAALLPAWPRLPLAGAGYVVPPVQGRVLFGATTREADDDASVREADHRDNLAQLARLLGVDIEVPLARVTGRTAWRLVAADRLPLVGAVPALDAAVHAGAHLEQPRFVVREPGLFVLTALGSRGIGGCALAAQVLASAVSGAPSPLEASLLDAVDPARIVSRAARRGAR
jgi:tRNA 5-methylaminomethyl-2-thiouridine biosynthesis bifunctional protein